MEIFRLFGSIFISDAEASKSLQKVDREAEGVGRTLQETIKIAGRWGQAMGKGMSTLGTAITKKAIVPLAGLTTLMGGLAKSTADYGDKVAKTSQEVGLSIVTYQELSYALGQNGVSADEFDQAMGNLNRRLGEARRGNAKYRETLKQLKFSLDDLDEGALDTEEGFMGVIGALSEMDDAQMQASLASEFFGNRVARKLMPAIRGGTEGIEELRQRAHDLGIVMDEQTAKKSELFGDTLDDLGRTMGGFSRSVGQELMAPLINIGKWLTDIVAGATKWIKENPKLVRQVVMFGGAVAGVLAVLFTLGTTLTITGKIVSALGVVFNILISKPMLIIAAIGLLWVAWENDWFNIRTTVETAWAVIKPVLDAIIEWGHKTIKTIWNWTTETASKFLSWVQNTAWPWINNTVSTAWDWTTGKISDFVAWIKDTAWPFIGKTATTTWDWATVKVSDFVTWVKDVAWPFIDKTATTTWDWTTGKISDFITWIKDVAWPFIGGVVTTTWNWIEGTAIPGIKEAYDAVMKVTLEFTGSVYDAVKKGLDTGEWGDFWSLVSDTWSKGVVIGIALSSIVSGGSAVLAAISKELGLVAAGAGATLGSFGSAGILGALTVAIQLIEAKTAGLGYKAFAQKLIWSLIAGFAAFGITANPKLGMLVFTVTMSLKWDWLNEDQKEISKQFTEYDRFAKEYMESVPLIKRPFTVVPGMDSQEYADWLSLQNDAGPIFETSTEKVSELNVELTKLEKQALIIAEVFKRGGDIEQALAILGIAQWETRGLGGFAHTDPETGDVVRGGAGEYGIGQVMPETGLDVWTRLWNQPAEAFDESMLEDIDTNIAMMVSYFMDRYTAEGEDTRFAIEAYNRGKAKDGMQAYTVGVVDWMEGSEGQSMFEAMYKGSSQIFGAWVQAGYDKEPEVRGMAAFVAQGLADYLIGQSPPPEGPLANIDEGASNVMDAWIEGAEQGVGDGKPKLTQMLESIKGLFASVWDKMPEEVKAPIEQAMGWITNLVAQAEDALFNLDELQAELDKIFGTGTDPDAEAQGFMGRLIDGLNDKLDKLDAPMNRFIDAVWQAGGTFIGVIKDVFSGNWLDAIFTILMETESFAKAMELLGKVMGPVVALFDAVLLPVIEAIILVWNFVLDKLASINVFGWRPFASLEKYKVEQSPYGPFANEKEKGDRGGSSAKQVSEITGPTRDLFVDLLSPLRSLYQIVSPIQDIRDILDTRLPYFDGGLELAGAGAGGFGGDVIIQNLNVHAPTTGIDDISDATLDAINEAMAKRYARSQRGRSGR